MNTIDLYLNEPIREFRRNISKEFIFYLFEQISDSNELKKIIESNFYTELDFSEISKLNNDIDKYFNQIVFPNEFILDLCQFKELIGVCYFSKFGIFFSGL